MNQPPNLSLVLASLLTTYGGAVICAAGPEGSGKSTFVKAIETAAPDHTVSLPFSKVLTDFCDFKEPKADFAWKERITRARKKMARRNKDIDPSLVSSALRWAMAASLGMTDESLPPKDGQPGKIFIVDGWPRLDWQARTAPNILGEFCYGMPGIFVEAKCDLDEAFRRALSRKGPTDTEDLIRLAHKEYMARRPEIISLTARWAHQIEVDTSGPEAQTVLNLTEGLDRLVTQIRQADGKFRRPDPALLL